MANLMEMVAGVLRDGKAMTVNEVAELINKGLGDDRHPITEVRSEVFSLEKSKLIARTLVDGRYAFKWVGAVQ